MEKKQPIHRRWIAITAAIFGLVIVCLPALISEAVGGWTRKYTSRIRFDPSRDIPDLTGKVVIVTGSNTGIGYQTALNLAKHGAHVIAAARNKKKGVAAIEQMLQEIELEKVSSRHGFGKLTFLRLDLSSLDSVSEFAKEFKALDIPLNILVLNAGIMKSPGADFVGQNMTYSEAHIGVNHIAHSHLTHLLLDQLKASAPSRVVTVSSMAEMGAYEDGFRFDEWKIDNGIMPESYEDGKAYGQSKLANLMFTSELAKRMNGTGVTAYSCHPGIIKSDLGRYMDTQIEKSLLGQFFELAMSSAKDGALTQLHLATAPVEELENGKFYHPIGRVVNPSHSKARNDELQHMLWYETEMAIKFRNKYRN